MPDLHIAQTSTSTVLHSASSQPNRGLKQTQAGCISHQVVFHKFFPVLLTLILTPSIPSIITAITATTANTQCQ